MTFWSALWQVAWLLSGPVSAGTIAGWQTKDYGPVLMTQDDETGSIRYSLCNGEDNTPIFPSDRSITVPLEEYPPKNGTSLAGGGWWDGTDVFVGHSALRGKHSHFESSGFVFSSSPESASHE